MKLQIEKPDWHKMICAKNGYWVPIQESYVKELHQWFQENVEPINKILSEAIEVTSSNGNDWNDEAAINLTHKAILINIQKIKPWSCPCGNEVMDADTEDCRTPLCPTCVDELKEVIK